MAKYGHKPINWFEGIVNKLGGEEAAERFLRGELEVSSKSSKTVTLGLHKTSGEYREALDKAGFRIGYNANDILDKMPIARMPCEVRLVIRSVAELGFTEATRYDAICARAKELDLDLCSAEVGPAVRLAHADQPHGEWLVVAMEAMAVRNGDLDVFFLKRVSDGRWLDAHFGDPDYCWGPGHRFVFVSREH